jgi:hypothetical protein
MNNTIETTIQRTRQYWYKDGFAEILTGLTFFLLGAINCISAWASPSMGTAIFVAIGYPLVILGAVFGGRSWVRSMKEKYTYPRTGYLKYIETQRSSRGKRIATAMFVAIAVSIVTMVLSRGLDPYWLVLGTGLLIAVFIGYMAFQIPLSRFFILAIWVVAVSLIAAGLPISEDLRMGFLLAGCGLGCLAGGGMALLRYMRETQPVNPEMVDEQ